MRYVGGKTRIAKWVKEHLLLLKGSKKIYLEPFIGSGATFFKIAPEFPNAVGSDAHKDLMLMWKALAEGWDPPDYVSKEEYLALKHSEPSALRGYVGFGASFSGIWFGGYVDTVWDSHWGRYTKPYLKAAKNSLLKNREVLKSAILLHSDYKELTPDKDFLVYCDPPYQDTLGYADTSFDTAEFWQKADEWVSNGATVVVSEEKAPNDWSVLATRERKAMLRVSKGEENKLRQECLFYKASK